MTVGGQISIVVFGKVEQLSQAAPNRRHDRFGIRWPYLDHGHLGYSPWAKAAFLAL